MNICVCGWYFPEKTYRSLWKLNKQYPVTVVANKTPNQLRMIDLECIVRENVGLEWGAYNHYVNKVWKGGDVLFTHDDFELLPMITHGYEIKPGEYVFGCIAAWNKLWDQVFVFTDREQDVLNEGQHGRMFYMSERLVAWFKSWGGPWFDEKNKGITKAENMILPNAGIDRFSEDLRYAAKEEYKVNQRAYIAPIKMGYRGDLTKSGGEELWPIQSIQ